MKFKETINHNNKKELDSEPWVKITNSDWDEHLSNQQIQVGMNRSLGLNAIKRDNFRPFYLVEHPSNQEIMDLTDLNSLVKVNEIKSTEKDQNHGLVQSPVFNEKLSDLLFRMTNPKSDVVKPKLTFKDQFEENQSHFEL
jgi:hypothetical protein